MRVTARYIRSRILEAICLLGCASATMGQEVSAGKTPEDTLIFSADPSDRIVVQELQSYLEWSAEGREQYPTEHPIVGNPACLKFEDPCPKNRSDKNASFTLPTKSGLPYEVKFERFDSIRNNVLDLVLKVSGGDASELQVRRRAAEWSVKPINSRPKQRKWEFVLSSDADTQDKTPEAGGPGGCWIEVPCP